MFGHNKSSHYISQAKVRPPVLPGYTVARTKIIDSFGTGIHGRIVKLSAPGGFGKTVAMAQIAEHCRQQGMLVVWLNLNQSDNDISQFLRGFSASLRLAGNANIDTDENASIADGIMEFFDTLSLPVAVFFDSLECVTNTAVLDLIYRGLQYMPSSSVIVIATRVEPEINFSRFRARGELTEFAAKDLRFSLEEARELFLEKLRLDIKPNDVRSLHAHTEGWSTALWLAALALQGRPDAKSVIERFSGEDTSFSAYLTEEVLAIIPTHVLTFLLHTSLLEELDEKVCNLIVGAQNCRTLLRECEMQNLLFREEIEGQERFRFNTLFREYLYAQFTQRFSTTEVQRAHYLACEYYISLKRPIPAIRQAIAAKRQDVAITLLQENMFVLLGRGRMRLLSGLIELVYKHDPVTDPLLSVIYAWCVTFTRGPSTALALVERLDEAALPEQARDYYLSLHPMLLAMMDRVDEAHALGLESIDRSSGHYPYANAMLHQVLSQTCIILGEHELARNEVDHARLAMRDVTGEFGLVLAESAGAILDLMAGRLRQATARIRLAIREYNALRRSDDSGIAMAMIHLAEMLYDSGQSGQAKDLLERNISLVRDIGPPDALIAGHVILSRIAAKDKDFDLAMELLVSLEADGYRLQINRVVASAKLQRANIYIQLEDYHSAYEQLTKAQQLYDWSHCASYWFLANDLLYPEIVNIRLHIRSGKAGTILSKLRAELKQAEAQLRNRRTLKLRILLAEAMYLNNEKNLAMRLMTRTINDAAKEDFVTIFDDEGEVVYSLRNEVTQQKGDDVASDTTDRHGSAKELVTHSALLEDALTPKEQQVLALLAQGISNAKIAASMYVSESTVRTHLRNINLKLNATNRTQALVIARQLGILR